MNSLDPVITTNVSTLMNFSSELSEFYVTSRNECHISNDDYLFQGFTLKPRTEEKYLLRQKDSLEMQKRLEEVGMKQGRTVIYG